jgi:integrase
MARPKNKVTAYRLHTPSGSARCWVAGKWVNFGRFNSPESRAEYAPVVAELAVAPDPAASLAVAVTVNELLLAFWRFAERHYRRVDGTCTNELPQFRPTFRLVRELYGHTPAAEFGPLALKAVRQKMIDAGWNRKLINQRVGRVRRAFKWAASEQLVPAAAYQALTTVAGLQEGRTAAKETGPVQPVGEENVLATLPHLQPAVAAMVRVQLLTGMRPGEVCQLRPCDLDTGGEVWLFRPAQYKTRHRGKVRVVAIGPKARAVLAAFTPRDPAEYYFSPRRVVEEFHASRRAARRTPLYPSHAARNAGVRKPAPSRVPADKYTVTSYGRAVGRAVKRVNARRLRAAGGADSAAVPAWHPNQLRHAHATSVRRLFGLEAAQVSLGHERADVTQVYAEKNLALAARVAAEVG